MDYTEQYSEWLSAYLDGELEPALEGPLFTALATHADLRQEMRELLALRRAARNDLVALVPPLSTTAAIFQSLGIGMGASIGASLLRRLWLPFAGALAGGALTWLAMTFLATPPPSPPLAPQQTAARMPSPETTVVERVVYRTRTVYLPGTASTARAEESAPAPPEHVATPSMATTPAIQPLQHQQKLALLDDVQPFRFTATPYTIRRSEQPRASSDVAIVHSPQLPSLPTQEHYPQFRLLLRGLATTSLVTVPQQPDRSSVLSTSAIGLLYTLSEHHAVGIEIGREPFAMQFYGYQEDTRLRYEAYPSLLWGVASYQYRTQLGLQWEPFAQLGVGATEFGLLGRATAGVVYRPAPSVSVMLGLEGAVMRYLYQSTPYLTPNVGITYGIMFRF